MTGEGEPTDDLADMMPVERFLRDKVVEAGSGSAETLLREGLSHGAYAVLRSAHPEMFPHGDD